MQEIRAEKMPGGILGADSRDMCGEGSAVGSRRAGRVFTEGRKAVTWLMQEEGWRV